MMMRILLAEDEGQLRRVVTMAMQHVGYQVDAVENGQKAVDYAASNAYDVIILDIMMPVMDGLEALRRIRAAGNHTYVIMLTAMAEVDDRVTGLDAGADDYITKPFSLKELLARLRSMERRSENYDTNVVTFGDVSLDSKEQVLESHNSISLSGEETRLMRYLMANAGKALAAKAIINHLDDSDGPTDLDDLWITISFLRQKLASIKSGVTITGDKGGPYKLEQNVHSEVAQ